MDQEESTPEGPQPLSQPTSPKPLPTVVQDQPLETTPPVSHLTVSSIPPEQRTHLLVQSQAKEGSYDEDSMISQTSSTSGIYK